MSDVTHAMSIEDSAGDLIVGGQFEGIGELLKARDGPHMPPPYSLEEVSF